MSHKVVNDDISIVDVMVKYSDSVLTLRGHKNIDDVTVTELILTYTSINWSVTICLWFSDESYDDTTVW